MTDIERCLDDTKPEYYDQWRENGMESLIPASFNIVDLPQHRWPNVGTWAWQVFMKIIKDFDGKYPDYVVGDLRRVITRHDRRVWVWDHNGAGDFVRISSHDSNDRLIVVFDHESSRSPYGEHDGYAPGLDFLQPIDLDEIVASDIYPLSKDIAAMTEAYRWRIGEAFMGADYTRIITSPEVLAEGNSFADEVVFDNDDFEWLSEREKERRPQFVKLYEDLVAGKLPSLTELNNFLGHDLVTAVAFDVMHEIHDHWIPTPEEQHRRWRERNKEE